MADNSSEHTVQYSVLDRLVDDDRGVTRDSPRTWARSVAELKRALGRDLEWLLNTRRIIEPPPDGYVELLKSLYNYGVRDISSVSGDSVNMRSQLMRHVEDVIGQFEPRISGAHVSLVEGRAAGHRQVRFVIEGVLELGATPEPVVFDTVLELSSGKYRVEGGKHAG